MFYTNLVHVQVNSTKNNTNGSLRKQHTLLWILVWGIGWKDEIKDEEVDNEGDGENNQDLKGFSGGKLRKYIRICHGYTL